MNVPKWAKDRRGEEKTELSRAARVAALYAIREQMPDAPKTEIAKALGISRWTLDRDLVTLAETDANINAIIASLETT